MSVERRSCTGSDPHVTKRLCAILMFSIGAICVFGGCLLGRMNRNKLKRENDGGLINLTIAAENLYKKAKRISPKAIHHNDPGIIYIKLLRAFNCTAQECGGHGISNINIAELVKNSINYHVIKLMRAINNATAYLDSLR